MARGFVQGREWGVIMSSNSLNLCVVGGSSPKAMRIFEFLKEELGLPEHTRGFTISFQPTEVLMVENLSCYVEEDDE